MKTDAPGARLVAPLRGRGLKLNETIYLANYTSRSLTGAWIETLPDTGGGGSGGVAPLRGRGLKLELESPAAQG